MPTSTPRRLRPDWPMLLITLTAFGLRVWRLAAVPPGWRDDELINVFVISQKILDGQLAFFYPDASGHEPLYHALHAIFMALFGTNALGFRLLSAIFGTLAAPLTYHLGRRLFSRHHGLIAAAALSVSFWSLVYSRLGMRHISLTVWTLLAFICFWRALHPPKAAAPAMSGRRTLTQYTPFMGAAFFTSLGFYTYFAGRGVPLILLAFCLYLALWQRPLLRARWRGLVLMFGLMALLALPLAVTLWQQPEAQGRVSELAVPLTAARAGDFAPLAQQTVTTLRMFHADGDPEWLYNIPHRPVLGIIGAAILWVGVGAALFQGARFSFSAEQARRRQALPYLFLVGWWAAGIFPGFISVPPASFGHTILAQPATFLLAALAIGWIGGQRWAGGRWSAALLGALLVVSVGWRDLPAYFSEWPAHGNTRFLYHANMRDVAQYAAAHPDLTDFGVSDLLAGPWSRLALQMELAAAGSDAQPRLYDPQRAIFLALSGSPAVSFHSYPQVPDAYASHYAPPLAQAGGYTLAQVVEETPLPASPLACFQNGLCAVAAAYDPTASVLEITWQVARPLALPPIPLISNPPPPGVYAGPRLWAFAHLVDDSGHFLSGDDGFWVDPQTLRVGDIFRQRHILPPPPTAPAAVHFGLYDPYTGARATTAAGIDHVQLPLQ